ncbi:transmembrane protein 186 [Numida meleagris]|uniref:transmembrane protein 186 n=1 Tax=Numida meleagris TaxID=8996 RepID=UPI000B3DBA2D|nr:transmembrane protein 186 [Numida meleagris]
MRRCLAAPRSVPCKHRVAVRFSFLHTRKKKPKKTTCGGDRAPASGSAPGACSKPGAALLVAGAGPRCPLRSVCPQVRLCCGTSGRAAPSLRSCVHGEPWRRPWKKEAAGPPCLRGTAVCLRSPNGPIRGARTDVPSGRLRLWAPTAAVPQKVGDGRSEEFSVVYRFPGIKYCRVLSRLKLLQTATTLLVLPPVCYLHLQQQLSQAVLLYTAGIALFAGVMLYGMSYFFRRIIGLIYLSESGRTVRVAHLTFWGRRNDIYCPLETVMTLDEVGDARGELLLQFKRYNSAEILYFTIKYGQIVDRQKFRQIFGELQ